MAVDISQPGELERLMGLGDKPADDLVASIVATHGRQEAHRVFDRLIQEPGVPMDNASVAQFINTVAQRPSWARDDLIDQAQEFFAVNGWVSFVTLGCASLPQGYVVREVALVLGTTQGMTTHVQRRIWETYQFVLDVMQPGGLAPSGPGIVSCQKVRLLHALIRYVLLHPAPASPDGYWAVLEKRAHTWPPDAGVPLSQALMEGTVLSFSYVTLRCLERLGYHVSDADKEAYLHAWAVAGHILGVRDELVVHDMDEAASYYEFRHRLSRPTEEGRELATALVGYLQGRVSRWWLPVMRPLPKILMVDLSGRDTTELLGVGLGRVERSLYAPVTVFLRLRARFKADVRRRWRWTAAVERAVFRLVARDMLGSERGADRGRFTIPEKLRDRWCAPGPVRRAARFVRRAVA